MAGNINARRIEEMRAEDYLNTYLAYNVGTEDIAVGDIVGVYSATHSATHLVVRAIADDGSYGSLVLAMVARQAIPSGEFGRVAKMAIVSLDTAGFSAGDPVYLNSATKGAITLSLASTNGRQVGHVIENVSGVTESGGTYVLLAPSVYSAKSATSAVAATSPTEIYVSQATGDDDTGDGTSFATGYATIERAMRDVVGTESSTETIIYLDGTGAAALTPVEYTMPSSGVMSMLEPAVKNDGPVARVRIVGDTFTEYPTLPITTDNSTSTLGWYIDPTGAMVSDAFRRLFLKIDGGSLDGHEALVYRNNATYLWAVPQWTTSGYPGSPGAENFILMEPSCKLVIPGTGDYVVRNVDFGSVAIGTESAADDDGVLCLTGDVCRINRAVVEVGTIDVSCAKFVTDFVMMANIGDNDPSNPGMLRVRSNVIWQCGQGLVVDGENAEGASSAHVKIEGVLDYRCEIVGRELGTYGFMFSGGRVWSGAGFADDPRFGFDDCDVGLYSNPAADGYGGGGTVLLHNRGSGANGVTGGYVINSAADAHWTVLNASTATASTGDLRVSATAGASASANSVDGTAILGVATTPNWGELLDPGDTGTISLLNVRTAMVPLTTAGTETRTLGDPTYAGQRVQLALTANTGTDVDVTLDSGTMDVAGNVTITFTTVGQNAELVAMDRNGLMWTLVHNDGGTLS